MATCPFSAKSLEELCFTHVVMTLEQYSTDSLSLLPKGFRLQLLHMIPIIDVCRLEDTACTSGIDIKSVWTALDNEYIDKYCYGSCLDRRESILMRLSVAIIKGERPYGYYQVLSREDRRTPWIGSKMNENRPVNEHKIDFVNFLVAAKHEIPAEIQWNPSITDTFGEERFGHYIDMKCCVHPPLLSLNDFYLWRADEEAERHRSLYGPVDSTMTRHEVTLVKGPVPPGKAYHEACRAKQLVPPRYTKFFSEGSSYLPDSTALKLIAEKCHFQPKDVIVHVPTFSTFVLNMEQELGSVDCLGDCFKGVESLTIQGETEPCQMATIISEATCGKRKNIARCALGLMLLTPNPKLMSLTIKLSTTDNVIHSITPALTAYGGLKELTLQAYGDVSPDFQNLISITEHQPLLHTVSILTAKDIHIYNSFHRVTHTPKLSEVHFISWLQTCFKKPLLQNLKLTLDSVSLKFLIQVITDFLSTPCSHEQTLTIRCDLKELPTKAVKLPPKPPPKPPRVIKSGPPLQPKGPTLRTPPPPPKPIHSSEHSDVPTTPIHQFDNACTMKYKCLTFDSCNPLFVKAFMELAPLKLKNMSILKNNVNMFSTEFLSQLAQHPLIEMESLEVELYTKDMPNFDSILQKKLLKFVTVTCSDSYFNKFSDISLRRGFEIKTIVKTPMDSVVFTLSRN